MPAPATQLKITQLCEKDRPREKLAERGAAALSSAELLAILIGSGNTEENAVQLMERVLVDNDGRLNRLGRRSIDELCAYKGMGPAKAVTILAACELGKRRMIEDVEERQKFSSSRDIFDYFLPRMKDLDVEQCHVLLLTNALTLVGSKCVSSGGITGTVVDIRLVMAAALGANAPAIALCHNHPSGRCRPSGEDDRLTRRIAEAAKIMDIRFIDHIVLTEQTYYSYSDEGKL